MRLWLAVILLLGLGYSTLAADNLTTATPEAENGPAAEEPAPEVPDEVHTTVEPEGDGDQIDTTGEPAGEPVGGPAGDAENASPEVTSEPSGGGGGASTLIASTVTFLVALTSAMAL